MRFFLAALLVATASAICADRSMTPQPVDLMGYCEEYEDSACCNSLREFFRCACAHGAWRMAHANHMKQRREQLCSLEAQRTIKAASRSLDCV
jgi:hypothetical protein